ncbi:CAP domain-containing protein [Rossellomorea aquimaris]|uniref:CAP domain-containing protein n=1 Tax=Rossellomorea aquimaris TaxID=189382 RepID=UPI001CD55B12|nr:CAP domain-containing protein [Rossellomorea aquimaris]MCA1054507.1 CAP domain-containing protein [Rossellomorea aquimaris]
MNKKKMLSAATALTLLASPLAAGSADAASPAQVKTQVQTLQVNNQEDLNKYIQDILSKYGVNGQNINLQDCLNGQVPQQQKEAPKQEAPKAEAQAPVQQQAPEAEAPAPAQQQAPKAEAPAPAQQQAPKAEAPAKPQAQPAAETGQLSQYEQKVVELTNQERAKQGLPALQVDAELSKVAKEKSRDMQANNYFSHNSPTYGSPFDMMKQFGIQYSSAGENIAMGQPTPEEVVQAWMNSEGHRKNIMNANYTHIGVGYVENGHYWTQQFISK